MIRGFNVDPTEFMELLQTLPESEATLKAYLMGAFGVLVTGEGYPAMWQSVERARGTDGAADVVAELVLAKGGKRVRKLIERAANIDPVHVRADDPPLVRVLFNDQGDPTWVGEYVADYANRSGQFVDDGEEESDDWVDRAAIDEEADDVGSAEEDATDAVQDLAQLISGKPRLSAQRGSAWTLERVQTPSSEFLTVPANWKEANLEAFLWANWEKLDLGLDRPVYLLSRQERLGPKTADRVDLLARAKTGDWYPIELKMGEASRGDFTQLLSYMADLERRGEKHDKIHGILVASSFGAKVLNAASSEPRVVLLRFRMASQPGPR